LYFCNGTILLLSRPYPWLASGQKDHKLYFAGGCTAQMARTHQWGAPGSSRAVCRIDYQASKGKKFTYWYHDHEPVFPKLVAAKDGYPIYRGGSYRIEAGGIVG